MSRFYGVLEISNKTNRTMQGTTDLTTIAASYEGAIKVELSVDKDGDETYKIMTIPWEGSRTWKSTICESKFKDIPHTVHV